MHRLKIIVTAIVLVAVSIGILMYNKSRSESKSRADVQSTIPVSVVTVSRQKLSSSRAVVGTIAGSNDVAIVSETQGKVTAVLADVGDIKQAGDALIQVDDELKQAAFATAQVNYEKARKDSARYESLFKQNAATDQQLESSRLGAKAAEAQFVTARRELRDTRISTPIAGVVTSRVVDVGTYIQKGTTVANVVDISKFKVKVNVAERDVFGLKRGSKVEIATDVYPGVSFEGTVRTVSMKSDEAHTYPVEITLLNSRNHPLKAGMFCQVFFPTGSSDAVLAIPREALVAGTKKPQVYTVSGYLARLKDITVGAEFGSMVTVLGGLQEGDEIVVNGQNNLRDSVAVSVIK